MPALFYVSDTSSRDSHNPVNFDVIDKIKDLFAEFLALSSLSLLQLGQSDEKVQVKNREAVYLRGFLVNGFVSYSQDRRTMTDRSLTNASSPFLERIVSSIHSNIFEKRQN